MNFSYFENLIGENFGGMFELFEENTYYIMFELYVFLPVCCLQIQSLIPTILPRM